MANATADQNNKFTILGVSSDDGKTPTRIEVDPESGGTLVQEVGGLFSLPYDKIVVTYTDSTKATISTVESYIGSTLQQTLTYTSGTTTDTYEVS